MAMCGQAPNRRDGPQQSDSAAWRGSSRTVLEGTPHPIAPVRPHHVKHGRGSLYVGFIYSCGHIWYIYIEKGTRLYVRSLDHGLHALGSLLERSRLREMQPMLQKALRKASSNSSAEFVLNED